MADYIDLLKEIAGKDSESQETVKHGKFRTSVMTSYTTYLPFYENVVLRRLVGSGCRYNVLLVDAHDLSRSLQDPSRTPRLAGRNYVLAPILVKGAFHPKIVMLLGEHNARIFVGSHNATLSGFGYNRELTTRIDLGKGFKGEHRAFFQQAWKAIESWINFQHDTLPPKLVDAILRIGLDKHKWLVGDDEQSGETVFLGSSPDGESLWERALPYLPKSPYRILVLGPFLDREGAFLKRLHDEFAPETIAIGFDAEAENTSLCKLEGLPPTVSFHYAATLVPDKAKRRLKNPGYLHAKALFFEATEGGSVLITGSANPSAPAWLADSKGRNVEAVVLHLGEKARVVAEELGLLKIPTLPTIGSKDYEEIYARSVARSRSSIHPGKRSLVAEVVENGVFVPASDFSVSDVSTCRVLFVDQPTLEISSLLDHKYGMLIEVEDNLQAITRVILTLADGSSLNLFVHNPIVVSKLAMTSRQQTFQDALDSLGGDSPDFAALFRITEHLIFDESKPEKAESKLIGKRNGSQPNGQEETPLKPLSVPLEETKSQQRRRRELHYGDLAYVIDALIYNLGIGLHDSVERIEDINPSEEEQVDTEEEQEFEFAPEIKKETLIKICHGKIGTLVRRMCKRLELAESNIPEGLKTIEQLLAVLAIFREIRANDLKLSHVTEGQTLVPIQDRKKLFEASLKALFGIKLNLFDETAIFFKDDPENDMPRLLGLIIWLAWDSGLTFRNVQCIPCYEQEARQEAVLELSRLFEIAIRAGKFKVAFKEAEHSAWRVCREDSQEEMTLWMRRYEHWARKLSKLVIQLEDFSLSKSPEIGQLGIAIRENIPKFRVILGVPNDSVQLAELGRDNNQIIFKADTIQTVPMPAF